MLVSSVLLYPEEENSMWSTINTKMGFFVGGGGGGGGGSYDNFLYLTDITV